MAGKANFGQFTTPTGQTGNIFSVGSWLSLILGVIVFLVAIATGQKLVGYIPRNPVLDTSIEDPINRPIAQTGPIIEKYGL
jgi:hypothetical protein